MSTSLKDEYVVGPLGGATTARCFRVSTIRTVSGGGADYRIGPFADSDWAESSPWPFEVMVFAPDSCIGLYHAPYETEEEALKGHQLVAETIKAGLEFGGGVEGPWGNPSTTADQWNARRASK